MVIPRGADGSLIPAVPVDTAFFTTTVARGSAAFGTDSPNHSVAFDLDPSPAVPRGEAGVLVSFFGTVDAVLEVVPFGSTSDWLFDFFEAVEDLGFDPAMRDEAVLLASIYCSWITCFNSSSDDVHLLTDLGTTHRYNWTIFGFAESTSLTQKCRDLCICKSRPCSVDRQS